MITLFCLLVLGASLILWGHSQWILYCNRREMARFNNRWYPLMQQVSRHSNGRTEYYPAEVQEPKRR